MGVLVDEGGEPLWVSDRAPVCKWDGRLRRRGIAMLVRGVVQTWSRWRVLGQMSCFGPRI